LRHVTAGKQLAKIDAGGSVLALVSALDWRLDGRQFGPRLPRLVLGWMTVFGRVNHLGISPSHLGQLSLLPCMRDGDKYRGQSAVMLCAWAVKAAGLFHLLINVTVWVAGKTV